MSAKTTQAGDPGSSLLALYDSAVPTVYGYLLSRCGSETLAEDLTSEVFLAAVDAVRRESLPTLSTAWLMGTARHKLIDYWRRAERERRAFQLVAGTTAETDDPWEAELHSVLTQSILQGLGAAHRAALTFRYIDDLPVTDVARLLDRTVHATETLLVRAKATFRRAYTVAEERHA